MLNLTCNLHVTRADYSGAAISFIRIAQSSVRGPCLVIKNAQDFPLLRKVSEYSSVRIKLPGIKIGEEISE